MDSLHWIAYIIGLVVGGIGAVILFKTSSLPIYGDVFKSPMEKNSSPKHIGLTCLAYLIAIVASGAIYSVCNIVFTNQLLSAFICRFLCVLVGSIVIGEIRFKKVGTLNNNFALIILIIVAFQIALSVDKFIDMLMSLLLSAAIEISGIMCGALLFKVYANKRAKH